MEGLILPTLGTDLVIPVAFDWPAPDRILEAIGDSTAKRTARASAAGKAVISDRFKLERETQKQILARLNLLKAALAKRLLADAGGLTDFRQSNLTTLAADVDKMVTQTTAALANGAERDYRAAGDLAIQAVNEPLTAAQLQVTRGLPGLDIPLVQAAFGNTVDLLTLPMQQYATQVKVALRAVALAGDGKFGAIAKLRDQIAGDGFGAAQYRAERIIRTELGRVFNKATFDRLLGLTSDFPFLRKGWRATGDRRTRLGHVQAGRIYARGSGIAISDRFHLQVYDERPGQAPKLMGVATLLFPVDPGAKPVGRIAAAATIMCRCNGFVDFDVADFASFTKAKVQVAIGNAQAPTPAPTPKPAPVPGDDLSMAKHLKKTTNFYQGKFYGTQDDMQRIMGHLRRTGMTLVQGKRGFQIVDGAGAVFGPDGWKMPAAAKVKRPTGLPIPKPATVTPTAVAAAGPLGTPIGSKLQIPTGPKMQVPRNAMAMLDKVHGDGPLDAVPLKASAAQTFYGQIEFARRGYGQPIYAKDIKISGNGLTAHPHNTVWHETGHWLDRMGITPEEKGGSYASVKSADLATWRAAVKDSTAIQTYQKWKAAGYKVSPGSNTLRFRGQSVQVTSYEGDGTIPMGLNRNHLDYALQTHEVFARSYAQYIAVRSGNPVALAELRRMQAQATTGPVGAATPLNIHPSGTEAGAAQAGKAWDYPNVWSDEDFKPIAQAFDQLFDKLGWRKSGG